MATNYKICIHDEINQDTPEVGDAVYVADRVYVGCNRRVEFGPRPIPGRCSMVPYRGNMSHGPILRGWCGTTNDWCTDSVGVGVVVEDLGNCPETQAPGEGRKARVRLAQAGSKAETELLARLGWEG